MKKIASACFEVVSIIISAFAAIAILFTFCFRIVGVNGWSMQNTLQPGDWLFVVPYYEEPSYGDIVISTQSNPTEGALVKRVIAVAGDKVDFIDGTYYVNGKALNESGYTFEDDGIAHGDRDYPITVPDDCVMCMGDHRNISFDCRYSAIGYFDKEYLMGKAIARLSGDWNIYANFNK